MFDIKLETDKGKYFYSNGNLIFDDLRVIIFKSCWATEYYKQGKEYIRKRPFECERIKNIYVNEELIYQAEGEKK